jgi:hypothetical protein
MWLAELATLCPPPDEDVVVICTELGAFVIDRGTQPTPRPVHPTCNVSTRITSDGYAAAERAWP